MLREKYERQLKEGRYFVTTPHWLYQQFAYFMYLEIQMGGGIQRANMSCIAPSALVSDIHPVLIIVKAMLRLHIKDLTYSCAAFGSLWHLLFQKMFVEDAGNRRRDSI